MGTVKFTRLATTLSWPLLRNKDCQDALFNGLELDKIDELVILLTRQKGKKSQDKIEKETILADLPLWMSKHIMFPIGIERHYQAFFIRRALNSLDMDIFIPGNKQEEEHAKSWMNYKNAPLNGLQIANVDSIEGLDKLIAKMAPANRYGPLKTALEKVR